MDKLLKEIFSYSLNRLNLKLSSKDFNLFSLYLKELKKWNKKINLTSLKTDEDIIIKHFVDSLSPVPFIPGETILLDVGSGGGFPGVPIKIVRPDVNIKLIESSNKKCAFLKNLQIKLNLTSFEVLSTRFENLSLDYRVGVIISRAFSPLEIILDKGPSYLKDEGRIILMLGNFKRKEEWLKKIIYTYGLKIEKKFSFLLPTYNHKRTIVVLKKC
jgi:16S rRNA (guanine527-N7)-methyltransferase